ncbi:NlpC/P60 family protein [Alicyclobacillus ferrooxydans]|uniref:NlpC/P60 family protein n=1 Tax=Alicyclobacillus ferrooxydans TaxID=471514 RepID=UPI0006D575D3|nr:NlpC/P60 family protein [Alicyclobacillus ferrooxydans]
MRNLKLSLITGALTVAAITPTAFAGTTQVHNFVETNHGWVSYHSAASLKSPILGRLLIGDKAPLVAKANAYWYEIKWNGKDVYITTDSFYTHLVTVTTTGTSPTQPVSPTAASAPASSSPATSPAPTTTPSWQVEADKVIATAKTQLNVPYLWGKQEPGVGFDCSNFTAWTFRTALGIRFSGSSVTQRNSVGTPVALSDIREGDLLFFATANNPTGGGHVGIYMGNGMVIQEGGGWGKVTIEPLRGTWLGRNLVFARRVIQ